MVHVLHQRYAFIIRLTVEDSANPATIIRIVVALVLPMKLQYVLTLVYPNVLA
jgi:hypothetical protein